MNEEIKCLLENEIKTEIKKLSTLKTGSEEKSKAIEDLTKLYRLKIEENKNDEKVKDRYFKFVVESAGIILPLIFYGIWMRMGFKFEETGTFTSTTFRNLHRCFKPTYRR